MKKKSGNKKGKKELRIGITPSVSSSSSGHVAKPETVPVEPGEQNIFLDRGPELPASYGEDQITALIRDPANLFFHWELDGPKSREEIARLGKEGFADLDWILRIENLSRDDRIDVAVHPFAGGWYLRVEENCEYIVDIGVMLEDGSFQAYARSNAVHTPVRGLAGEMPDRFDVRSDGRETHPLRVLDPRSSWNLEVPSSWVWSSSSGLHRDERGPGE